MIATFKNNCLLQAKKIFIPLSTWLKKPLNTVLFVLVVLFAYYFCGLIYDGCQHIRVKNNYSESFSYTSVEKGLSFTLPISTKSLKTIHFPCKALAKNPKFIVEIENFNDKDFFIEQEIYLENDVDSVIKVNFYYPIKKDNLTITITSSDLLLKQNSDSSIPNKQYGLPFHIVFILEIVFLIFFFSFFCIIIKSNTWKIENRYLFFSIFFGVLFLFIRPPCSQYDDLIHYDSAYNMSNIILGYGDSQNTCNLPKRACDLNLLPNYYPINYQKYYHAWHDDYRSYYIHLIKNFSFNPDIAITDSLANKVIKPQRAFIFSAFGITIARLIGLNQFLTYYFGAFINLAICLALVYIGIRKNVYFNRHIILCISLFPVVSMLFASYSYDALLIAGSFCLINYAIAMFYQNKITMRNIIYIVLLSLFIIPIKTVYFLMAFYILLLLFFKKETNMKHRLSYGFICILICYLILIILCSSKKLSFLISQQLNYIDSAKYNYSISYLILHPLNSLKLVINSLFHESYSLSLHQLFFKFDGLDYDLPILNNLSLILFVSYFLSIKKNTSQKTISLSSSIVFIGTSILLFIVGISWTGASSNEIWGLQARYFLPCLPLLFFSLNEVFSQKISYQYETLVTANCCIDATILLSFFYMINMFLKFIF